MEQTVGAAVLAAGLLVTGCGARSGGDGNANSTVNLASLPAAEVWVDGKAQGSTPLAVPLAPGRHELVLKQTGFAEHRQTLDVASGAVSSVDATLQPLDPMDPDAVRLVAAAYGVTVEPFRAPEVHRGAASVGGVSLLYPRNDVRKEGLAGYRVDVTPAYEGGGWLEFRKGKTSLYRQKFEPDTLVSAAALPPAVLDAVKIGDTVTWGVYFTDARKAITAQFEIVAKPTATKKLAELQADRRLALQPVALRQQLEAEVLQNYRLYSEALVRLLDIHAADKDSAVPYSGIVSCLRRLDLEDTALFSEASSKSGGLAARRRTGDVAGLPTKRLPVGTPSSSGLPTPNDGASAPTAPATPAPTPGDSSAAAPGHRDPVPSLTPPAPSAPGLTPKDPTASKGPVDPNASPIDPKNSPMPPATGPGVAPVAPTPSAPTPPALPGESAMPKPLAPPVPPTPPAGVPVPPADPVAPIGPTPPAQPDAPIPPVQPDGQTPPPPADPVPPMNPPPTTDPVPPMNPPPPADPVPPMNPPPPSDPIPPMQPK